LYTVSNASILALLGFIPGGMTNFVYSIIVILVATIVATVVTYLFGFTKEQLEEDRNAAEQAA
ncbi:MAG: hypothetical protein Q4C09_10125, partial [Atopobiaceae bacterium]|nr:hypothetical protein [Atopobiaceae bacterium]